MNRLLRPLLLLAIAGLIFSMGIAMSPDNLLYFPDKATVEELASGELRAWPGAADFRGLVAEPVGPVRGTAIVFTATPGMQATAVFTPRR